MTKLEVFNDFTYIDDDFPEQAIDDVLVLKKEIFTTWDEKKKKRVSKPIRKEVEEVFLFELPNGLGFPTPAIRKIIKWFDKHGVEYKIIDRMVEPNIKNKMFKWSGLKLRYYQEEAVKKAISNLGGVFVLPTGSGKTMTNAKLIYELNATTLYIVPKRELLIQAIQDFSFLTDRVGELKTFEEDYDIFITTPQKLWYSYLNKPERFEDFAKKVDLIIADEAHHARMNPVKKGRKKYFGTWFTVITRIPAFYKYGCTATVDEVGTYSRESLELTIGNIFYEVPQKDLTEQGYLSDVEVHWYDIQIDNDSYEWMKAFDNLISYDKYNRRIALIARSYNKAGYSVLIFIDRVEKHGNKLKELLPEAEFVHGSVKTKERARIKNRLLANEKIIVISSVYGEGVDIPSLDVAIITGGVGRKAVMQKIGRLTRVWGGKKKGILVDFNHLDGFYYTDERSGKVLRRKYLLEIHSGKRLELYEELGLKIVKRKVKEHIGGKKQ